MAAFRYLPNRMISLPLTTVRKKKWQKILSIAQAILEHCEWLTPFLIGRQL
jgi:hypothetical protein